MGKKLFFLLVLVVCCVLGNTASGFADEGLRGGEMEEGGDLGGGGGGGGGREMVQGEDWFLLQDSRHVIKTEAGHMRVVRSGGKRAFWRSPMHIGFITMEPNSLFIPQYLDSSLILFIRRGEARVAHIYKDELAERQLKTGDIYRIGAGSAFYIVNTAEGQRLDIICSIDTSERMGWQWFPFQSFFVAGGTYPTSVLAGFDPSTLSTAFNVTMEELGQLITRQTAGPIVYLSPDSHPPSIWSKFLDLEQHQRLAHLKRTMHFEDKPCQAKEKESRWSWRKLLISIFGEENKREDDKRGKGPDSYNLYDRKADFKNDYGWSKALDESDYPPLRHSGMGVYLVNLTAGSMMAPHINPTATEYGIVLRGSGRIQIVFPNGTMAMNAKVTEGSVFRVPRYFPFCQIASRTGPFEFFGYTTSSRKNRPQFLVGRNSLLQTLRGPETAAAFGVTEERLKNITEAQRESVILPSPSVAPPELEMMDKAEMKFPKWIKSFGNEMIMGFD